MSRFKIFLLGLIISILSFGAFSYSQFYDTIEIHCDPSSCDNTMNFTCSSSDCSNYGYICTTNAVVQYGGDCMRFSDGWIGKTLNSFLKVGKSLDLSEHGLCNIYGMSLHDFHFNYSASGGPATITCKRVTSSMPVSALTPAINGLHDTIIELIPYIVYLGIGILLFTLGFFAIRRLVNWLSGKLKSTFSSKKR